METLAIFGQIIFGAYFTLSGLNHFMKHKGMTGYAQSKKLPMSSMAVMISGLILLAGGLSIILGYQVEIGLWLLIGLLFLISFLMHNFWAANDDQAKMADMTHFLKNWALIGAMLMMLQFVNAWPWMAF